MHRAAVAVLAAATLAACASASPTTEDPAMRTLAAGESTAMHIGETARLPDGATLRYVSVPQDSRCPPNARCIRAGDADILFEFAIAGGPSAQIKPNLPEAPSKNMGAWRLTVLDLEFNEAPAVQVRIDPAQ